MNNTYIVLIAYILDLILGDPFRFHPVRVIGKLIQLLENILRKYFKNLKLAGFLLVLLVILLTGGITYSILILTLNINKFLCFFVLVWIMYTTIAVKDLKVKTFIIMDALNQKDLEKARFELSFIVGRDTQNLNESEVVRAVIETISENFVDGILSPIFYGILGGPTFAIIYKAINTMDSMIGYKNEKYIDFGMFAAKLDDIANYIPARMSPFFLSLASLIYGFEFKNSIKMTIRDGKKHSSPNSGIPESCIAGALNIRLGGGSSYHGKYTEKPFIGDPIRNLKITDIIYTYRIILLASLLLLFIMIISNYLCGFCAKLRE